MTTLPLVADCGGIIREMAICMPPMLFAPNQSTKRDALRNLIEALADDTILLVLTERGERRVAEKWISDLKSRASVRLLADAPVGAMADNDFWIQDPFLVAGGTERALLKLPASDRLGGHADWLLAASYQTVGSVPFHLTGGNHLCGPDYRIVGAGSLGHTMWRGGGLAFADIVAQYETLDARRQHVFGFPLHQRGQPPSLAQQPHHVDLALSVTGCRDNEGRPIVLLAEPLAGNRLDAAPLSGWAEQLALSAERLADDGFAVRRNPVPYVSDSRWSPNPDLRAYNNVILENGVRPGRVRPLIWLPHFCDLEPALTDFDAANRAIWEGLGFDVVPVYGCSALVRAGGAIRCASKVLRRDPLADRHP